MQHTLLCARHGTGAAHKVSHLIFAICKVVVISSILQIEKLRLRKLKQPVNNNKLMETRLVPVVSIVIVLLFHSAASHHLW